MPAVIILIALILIAVALSIVNIVNRIQERDRTRRLQQRKLKIQADSLMEIVNCLEHTVSSKIIAKLINDEVIKLLKGISQLNTTPQPTTEASINHAEHHSEELMSSQNNKVSYQKGSEEKTAHTLLQLNEAIKLIRHLCFQNIISEGDLSNFERDISWSYLMVSVSPTIARGQRLLAAGDKFTSRGLFEKAQKLLTESLHPDPRRLEMVKELNELMDGSRDTMSERLLLD